MILKIEVVNYTNVVEVPSWNLGTFSSLNNVQDSTNKVDKIVLSQNNNNIMNSIFGSFDLVNWWESKAIEGSTLYPFEEVTDNY